jgi:hypothetical protein
MSRGPDKSKFSKPERARLRELAGEAWNAELSDALTELHEEFRKWADDAMDAFELSDKIHEFHNGLSRELYGRYTFLDSATLVSRAVALGLLEQETLGDDLLAKLSPEIELIQKKNR